jgi:hypothetical protein
MKVIYLEKAVEEYKELRKKITNYTGSFEELCEELNGFNEDEEMFDINYKSITTTIYNKNGKIKISEYIDIWNDEEAYPIEEMLDIRQYERGLEK